LSDAGGCGEVQIFADLFKDHVSVAVRDGAIFDDRLDPLLLRRGYRSERLLG
jgi:hypothetical protein